MYKTWLCRTFRMLDNIPEHSRTFWNFGESVRTFWNIYKVGESVRTAENILASSTEKTDVL